MSYVYEKTEPYCWTVGHHDPTGKFVPESDHESKESAAARVRYLNGGRDEAAPSGHMAREYFAGQALTGLLAARVGADDGESVLLFAEGGKLSWNHCNVPVCLAKLAFDMADAMLIQAQKGAAHA